MLLSTWLTKFEGRPPRLLWLAGGKIAVGDFVAGLIEFGFDRVGEFQLVFQIIINPGADFLNLTPG
jgi:hypothetical protein